MKERTLSVSVFVLALAVSIGAVCLPAPAAQANDDITIGQWQNGEIDIVWPL